MKHLRKIIFSTAISALVVTGCNTNKLKDLNIDPSSAPTIDVNFLFTSAQLGAASAGDQGDNRYIDWRTNIGITSTAIQQLATQGTSPNGPISSTGDKYLENVESINAPWERILPDLRNLAEVIKQTGSGGYADGKSNNTRQAARILRAFLFSRLTDYYGSIPYTEALQATSGVFYPKYDKQKAIYTDLLKELDEASVALSGVDADFAAADLYYKGDIAKWKRWGYSLMLRLAMRVSNVDADMANTYVTKAVAGGVFQSNEDNAVVPMAVGPSLWVNQNGISRAFIPDDGGEIKSVFLSKTLIDFLKGANAGSTVDDDPRLMIFSGGIYDWPVETSVKILNADPLGQKGMPNGNDLSMLKSLEGNPSLVPENTYSRINPKLLNRDDPYMLMNYGEVKLLLAEAAQRGIGGLSAAAAEGYYKEGVKASMQMYTIYDPSLAVTDAQVNAYLTARPYAGLASIGQQLWANLFLNWWEAWTEWRRTGYPNLTPTHYPGNVTGGKIPQKLRYPTTEVAGNPNFKTGASANDYTTKVWWAGGPE
ncbi:SusD/RagB family nutrient-binding outer membrane lipoprotein [Segetibacter koreensis]|uniref:SusD/RagB family nutrient-binding outer membrane lipoprotein n=1 Tax=Segetibacter koreensis TaxID=398037 RepID=UPI0003645912|nr:SusD/RagB family nutrient-binding outer membrane lipoprotein [Segetibacter koreensis]